MIGVELSAHTVDEALRVVRALGAHRYVGGRMHLVHAFAVAAASDAEGLGEARGWAERALGSGVIDVSSRDERLFRRASEAEVLAVLDTFWRPGPRRERAHARLRELLERAELPLPDATPFDEDVEEDIHPLLVDAGWELIPLRELHPERHRGVIEAFDEAILLEAARFEEAESIPPVVHLQELPALGPVELLRGADEDGALAAPLTIWVEGNEVYQDYVIRGVTRAAKLPA